MIEEFEEITFSLKRTRKLTVDTEESAGLAPSRRSAAFESEDAGDVSAQRPAAQPMPSHRLSAQQRNNVRCRRAKWEPARVDRT